MIDSTNARAREWAVNVHEDPTPIYEQSIAKLEAAALNSQLDPATTAISIRSLRKAIDQLREARQKVKQPNP